MQIKSSITGHPPLIISVVGPHGCWVANRIPNSHGYISAYIDGRRQSLHRYFYERIVGPIPQGHDIHHAVCENKACCNPMHVQPIPKPEHQRISRHTIERATRTHCPHGHEYSGDNLGVIFCKKGYPKRRCRECHRKAGREYRRKKNQADASNSPLASPAGTSANA